MSNHPFTFAQETRQTMKTFILEWDPALSPYGLIDFQHDFARMEYGDFEWQLEDNDDVRSGDNFYMVKTGSGNCGVVMKGFFLTDPWPCKGASVVDLRPLVMVHPDHPKGILQFSHETSLQRGPLSEDVSFWLNSLWMDYLTRFSPSDYDGILLGYNAKPLAGIDEAIALASEALFDVRDSDGHPAIIHSLKEGLMGKDDDEMICGFLHDVLLSPDWSLGDLRDKGFSEQIVDRLSLS